MLTKELFIKMYNEAESLKELCKILNCSRTTIYKNAKKLGLNKKKPGRPGIFKKGE